MLVNGRYKAVVKFVGETSFKAGTWYGVELDKPKGKHDGCVRFAPLCLSAGWAE